MKREIFFYLGYVKHDNVYEKEFSFVAQYGYGFYFDNMRFYVTNCDPFIYEGGKGKMSGWTVTHYDTGTIVAYGATRKEAMANITAEVVEKVNKAIERNVFLHNCSFNAIDLMHEAYKIREGKLKEGEDIYQIYLKDIEDGKYNRYL